jgi:hypothetical protein
MLSSIQSCLLSAIFRMDSQVFGILAPFPVIFLSSNAMGLLSSFLLLQITLKESVLSVVAFVMANSTAYIVGGYLGNKLEEWHSQKSREVNRTTLKGQYISVQTEDDFDTAIQKNSYLSSLRYYGNTEDEYERPPRHIYFKLSLLIAVFLGNLMGSMTCGPVVKTMPTILLGWKSIAEVEADYTKFDNH